MLTRLAKIRNKVASSVVSQKDKHNPYLRTDASCSLDSEFEAVPDITNSNFSKLPKWTGEEEHDKQSESGVLHAEIWFPTEPTANMSVKAVDFSYAESRTPESKASSTTFSVAEEEIHIGAPVLPAYEDAEEQFLEEYEDYFEHLSVDNVRKEQYPKLELQRLVYLAYASSPLFSRFQVEEHMRILLEEGPCLGSASILDDSFANLTSYIISTQERLLQLLNTTKDDYSIIFTTGITDGFRLFGDMYPFQRGSLVLVCRDNQEYVKHVVHAAGRQGARMTMAPVGELDLCMHGPELHRLLRKQGWNTGGTGLFIYPAQSCLSGLRHSLNWTVEAQQNGWQVLLDVSSYLPLGILDLSLYQPDFLAGSFYHMLGYPSGIGFLLIHRKSHSIERLNASNSLKLTASPDQGKSCHVVSEDNSINLLTFSALSFGLEHLETVSLTAIQKRSECLAAWLFRTLKSLKHKSNEGKSLLQSMLETEFFTEYGEANRYHIQEVVGKGSYGVVVSAIDTHTGEKVAIKKINDVFEHVSDATRILREIKLLRLLRHPDIVEIKHIMLPPSRREFKDIYVVFELMESDLHQVIKANDDLTPEHYQFFLYQLLRALKYIHTANVFHRDLKPKNILANADCKLKICDFGLARVSFNDAPSAIFWTDYVATRWYRAPELCGSFFSKYTPAIDIWSIGCIFAEMLTGKPLFPGKNVVHQLDLMTDMLGTPSSESIARIRNEKARRYLSNMRKKQPIPFSQKFPNVDPLALHLLERLLAFDPKDRPTAEEALADPYFRGLAKVDREPSTQPISKLEFEFERRRLTKDDVRELIYREILEYHPQMLQEYLCGADHTNFMYPSALDLFKRQFAHLEEHYGKGENSMPLERQHASLPRERVFEFKDEATRQNKDSEKQEERSIAPVTKASLQSPPRIEGFPAQPGKVIGSMASLANGASKPISHPRSLVKSASISSSQCTTAVNSYQRTKITVKPEDDEVKDDSGNELSAVRFRTESMVAGLTRKVAAMPNGVAHS